MRGNSADHARAEGWEVGTVLIGSPVVRNGRQVEQGKRLRITAIGEQIVLGRCMGKDQIWCQENSWEFTSRDWVVEG